MTIRIKLQLGMILLAATLGLCGAIYGYASIYDGAYGPDAVIALVSAGLLILTMPSAKRQRKKRRRRRESSSRDASHNSSLTPQPRETA
jgi:hypothetical protein